MSIPQALDNQAELLRQHVTILCQGDAAGLDF